MKYENKQFPTQGEWTWRNTESKGLISINAPHKRVASIIFKAPFPDEIVKELQGTVDDTNVAQANAQAICTAINNTYGKNLNPNGYEPAMRLIREINEGLTDAKESRKLSVWEEAILRGTAKAIKKAKL